MRIKPNRGFYAALLLVVALPLGAYTGFVVGEPVPGQDLAECDTSNLVFTTPDKGAALFVLRENDPADIMYSIEGNTKTFGGNYAVGGDYDFPSANFPSGAPVTSNDETIWVVVAAYPGGAPGDTHEGWIMIDNSCGLVEDMAAVDCNGSPGLEANVMQRVRLPEAVAGYVNGGSAGDPTTGFDFSFEYLTEFGGSTGNLPCQVGGVVQPAAGEEFDARVILGFNVYRINLTANGLPTDGSVTDPLHYLCGADRDCTDGNGAEGWIGFIPLDPNHPAGLSVDDPSLPTQDAGQWPAGVENRTATPNVDIIFSDRPVGQTTDTYSYVYQPVIKGQTNGTWNGIPCLDVDGDTFPEALDPSGNGLGLCANGANPVEPYILISADAIVDGTNATPVGDALNFTAIPRRGNDGLDVSFLSSIEADIVGYDVYRSFDGQSYIQINEELIPAAGKSLTSYSLVDGVNYRRARTGSLFYKVGVVHANGTVESYGPYEIELPFQGRERSRVGRR